MGDRTKLLSPLKRARMGLEQWIDLLPEDAQPAAGMAIDRLCEMAEREIEQAYYDGHKQRRDSEQIKALREATPPR